MKKLWSGRTEKGSALINKKLSKILPLLYDNIVRYYEDQHGMHMPTTLKFGFHHFKKGQIAIQLNSIQ